MLPWAQTCILVCFPSTASQQDLGWNNFETKETPWGSFQTFIAFHTHTWCHDSNPFFPNPFISSSSLNLPFIASCHSLWLKESVMENWDQVTKGHLTSFVFTLKVCPPPEKKKFPLKSFHTFMQTLHFQRDKTVEDWSPALEDCWKPVVLCTPKSSLISS